MESFLLILMISCPCSAVMWQGTILKINSEDIVTPLSHNVVNARSLMDCTGQCLLTEMCLSALYQAADKTCRLNDVKVFLNISSMATALVLVPLQQVCV